MKSNFGGAIAPPSIPKFLVCANLSWNSMLTHCGFSPGVKIHCIGQCVPGPFLEGGGFEAI